jgi:hypothetical protein
VHDTASLEIDGVPSVFVASSEFVDAAEVQSRALGLPEVHRVIVPHPIQDATDEEMREKADSVLEAIVRAATAEAHS